MNCLKHISCLFAVLLTTMMHGQSLPSLGKAQEISSGKLPNGMSYYIVANPAQKGSAEYALVQKGPADPAGTRAALSGLPNFGTRSPYRFLGENGIGYDVDGLVRYDDDATVFNFHDVPAWNASVSDSTLLLMFNIASRSTAPQAVIVSGDVSADKVKERMNLFSMTVPQVQAFTPSEYEWVSREGMAYKTLLAATDELVAVNVIYSSQRFPRASLDTVEPVLTRAFASQLGYIFQQRLEKTFAKGKLKLAGCEFRYKDASMDMEDERYIFTVYISEKQLNPAVSAIAAILSDLDRNGASLGEFRLSRAHLANRVAHTPVVRTNGSYVDQCASAWLYGTTLASDAVINTFMGVRQMDDWQELSLFNGFVKALLSPDQNVAIRCDVPRFGIGEERVPEVFAGAWASGGQVEPFAPSELAESVKMVSPNLKQKVKLKSESKEIISGGSLWTFSNGIKVIYKKTAGAPAGTFSYALLLKGGNANPYMGDMFALSRIGGVEAPLFHSYLEGNGITMQEEVDLSDFVISGKAPKDKVPFLMEALLTVCGTREADQEAFEHFRESERLRDELPKLFPIDVKVRMDSTLSPDSQSILHRSSASLTGDLATEADRYFKSQFEMVNDGVLVFIGDVEAETLKKELTRVLGSFTTGSHYAQRAKVDNRLASGTMSYVEESAPGLIGPQDRSVSIALSANVPFNTSNQMAFTLACELVRRELVRIMAPHGASVEVSGRVSMFPSERLSLYVRCRPCRPEGLPAEVGAYDADEVASEIRSFVSGLADMKIDQEALKAGRNSLLAMEQARMKEDAAVMEKIHARYSEGKDLVTGYQDAIKGINAEKVKSILGQLKAGAGVEYVIR